MVQEISGFVGALGPFRVLQEVYIRFCKGFTGYGVEFLCLLGLVFRVFGFGLWLPNYGNQLLSVFSRKGFQVSRLRS